MAKWHRINMIDMISTSNSFTRTPVSSSAQSQRELNTNQNVESRQRIGSSDVQSPDCGCLAIVLHSPSCQSPPVLTLQAGPRRGTRRAAAQDKNCSHGTKFIGVRVRGPCHEVSRDRCHVEAVTSMRDSITSPRCLRPWQALLISSDHYLPSLLLSAPSTTFSSFADGASCNTEFTNFFFYWISHMLIKFKSSSSSQSEVQLTEVRAAMAKLAHGREIRIKVECVSVFKSHLWKSFAIVLKASQLTSLDVDTLCDI